jgi:signal transduction histidine kinase
MEKTREELTSEMNNLKAKYSSLETKYKKDLGEAKRIEQELRLKLLFLESVANSTIDGFLVVDPFGQKILQTQRTVDLWKIPQEVVDDPSGLKQVAHVMHMTVNPQQFVAEINKLKEHPSEKSQDELELIDGTFLDRYSSPVIGPDGKNYGRIWTFHDITERKNLEKQLIQLNKDKDHFISVLAHDLRNPISSISGLSGLLLDNLPEYTTEKLSKIIESIFVAANRTNELLEDTLLWATSQSRNITFNPSVVNLNEIILETLDIHNPGAKAKNISIEYPTRDQLQIFADIYMLKAIMRNLITNAIKFTKKNGRVEISVTADKKETLIKVSDNGIGIEPIIAEKLFNIGSVQSSKGTENEVGTGLGLMLCKEFVNKHNGKIWIESIHGKGTTVNFTIPTNIKK